MTAPSICPVAPRHPRLALALGLALTLGTALARAEPIGLIKVKTGDV